MKEITNNQLRAIAGLILLVLAIVYMNTKIENQNLEFIMIALAGSIVGIALNKNTPSL